MSQQIFKKSLIEGLLKHPEINKPLTENKKDQILNECNLILKNELNNIPSITINKMDNYTVEDIKELLKNHPNLLERSKTIYINNFKKTVRDTLSLEPPYNMDFIEKNIKKVVEMVEQLYKPSIASTSVFILKEILTKLPKLKKSTATYLEKQYEKLKKIRLEEEEMRPPNKKEIENKTNIEQFKITRDTLKPTIHEYDKNSMIFLISSIFYHIAPFRPVELSNSSFKLIPGANYIDLKNKKWVFLNHKNKEDREVNIPDDLIKDIIFIKDIHGGDYILPYPTKLDEYAKANYLIKIFKQYWKDHFNIPNFTFQINRKSLISQKMPSSTTKQKKALSKASGHSFKTQQMTYNPYNQT